MIAADAPVPSRLSHPRFVATPLTLADVAVDYAAYMASPDVIRVHSDGRWPVDGFTLDENRELAARHQADHEARRAFTFLLLDPSETESLGCLYLNPLRDFLTRSGVDARALGSFPTSSAMVTFWVRQDLQETGLVDDVAEAVHEWLVHTWPLETCLYRILPGEQASRAALERLAVRRVQLRLPGEERPFLWYQPN